jgi:uncharacterized protein (TIGR00299 family) protein
MTRQPDPLPNPSPDLPSNLPANLLWVDAGNGAAGDMLLGALLDAGADLQLVRDGLAALPVEPVSLRIETVRRHGLRAAKAHVAVSDTSVARCATDVLDLVAGLKISEPARLFAVAVFRRLAEAEARVHGIPLEQVHLHEVGALDALADVVGCALALDSLGLLRPGVRRVVSPVAVGSGSVKTMHGRLPVPAPAVVELLIRAGAPIAGHPAVMELCTPTGAALLAELADDWGPLPDCRPVGSGVGAGSKDPPGHANTLRVLLSRAEADGAARDWREEDFLLVEATVDDLDPRLWPDVLESLRAAGAADAWCTPALMRKGRPGQVLSALTGAGALDGVCHAVFTLTTTLGLRVSPVLRRSLARDQIVLTHPGGPVAVKRGILNGRVITSQPEYEDVLAAARALGLPPRQVLDQVRLSATEAQPVETVRRCATHSTTTARSAA